MKTKLTHYTNGMKLNAKGFEGSKLVNPKPSGILIYQNIWYIKYFDQYQYTRIFGILIQQRTFPT